MTEGSTAIYQDGADTSDSLSEPRYWFLSAGEGGRLWSDFKENNLIAISWDELGDLSAYSTKQAISTALQQDRGTESKPVNDSLACYQFSRTMKINDYVFVKRGRSEILGYGKVSSAYHYADERSEYKSTRNVEWLATGSWLLPRDKWIPQKTLTDLTSAKDFIQYALRLVQGNENTAAVPETKVYRKEDALKEIFFSQEQLETILSILARKKNLILAGPPGVGKTFAARRIAYSILGEKEPERIQMVQFHQSYAYEDFIQGWRPNQLSGFTRRDGLFYEFCKTAQRNPQHSYVFIIDEINRGNLSKIFGELMVLLEADKRGPEFAIPLTYSTSTEERFFIPENLYILGMMNTADRSLAMVDFALRRRFGFFEIRPAYDSPKFRDHLTKAGVSIALQRRIVSSMTRVNQAILDDKDLGRGFEIGHSFFVPIGTEDQLDEKWFTLVVSTEIEPLLNEYWFDRPDKARDVLGILLP